MIKSGYMNEAVDTAERKSDIEKLKKMLAREKEIKEFIMKNGFEKAMKYKDEFHKLTSDIGQLAMKIDGPGAIYGKGILYKLSEAIESPDEIMNESAKIRKMTQRDGMGFSGCWQLPSGDPGLAAESAECSAYLMQFDDVIQLMIQDNEGDEDSEFYKNYSLEDEKKAIKEFNQIAKALPDYANPLKRIAKQYGMKSL